MSIIFFFVLGESPYEGENMTEERKQREQLLELNHLIARQVMEKSRMVAGTLKFLAGSERRVESVSICCFSGAPNFLILIIL